MNKNIKFLTLFIILLFAFFFLVKFVSAKEPGQVLFINQVRGEECCQKGSLENLKGQVKAFKENKIPAYFTLRYDVLKNPKYLNFLKENLNNDFIKLGLLIEITPQLAADAGVVYKGNKNDWFEAQNIFTIGYSEADNQKLIDQLFTVFKENFGFYPDVTCAWMIGTKELNHMTDKYGVKIHEITKEQYNTDSYTLYGGPPHYPYPAGQNWLLVPDYERKGAPLIVRQTITDPLYNYGEKTANFTSQPNDYMQGKKDFNYFKKLFQQAINQKPIGFALLGLENSMDKIYQQEYLSQIKYVKKLIEKNEITFPQLVNFVNYWSNRKVTVYSGEEAYWINTPRYRVRLIVKNNHWVITDLRVYDKNFPDPYSNQLAQKEGFWIMPYLIDGSHWYRNKNQDEFFPEIKNDMNNDVTRLEIADYKKDQLTFLNNGEEVKLGESIVFKSSEINISSADEIKYINFLPKDHPIKFSKNKDKWELSWQGGKKISHSLVVKFDNNKAVISFQSDPQLIKQLREKQYPYMFPEPIVRKINPDKSKIIVHNRYAIAGRNPVRIVIIPYDDYGVPSLIKNQINIETNPSLNIKEGYENKINFVDIASDTPIQSVVSIKLSNKKIKEEKIYFSPNCFKAISTCLKNPQYFWWYINTIIRDKLRLLINNEKQN